MKLTKNQVADLKGFVESAKSRAEMSMINSKTPEERAFYIAIIEKADRLLPLLTGRESMEIEDEEEET